MSGLRGIFVCACLAALTVASAISFSAVFERANFLCQLLVHLRLVWLALIAFATLGLVVAKSYKVALLGVVSFAINFIQVGAMYVPRQATPSLAQQSAKQSKQTVEPAQSSLTGSLKIRVLQMNVWGGKNKEYARAAKVVHDCDADIVGFSEVTENWVTALKNELPEYKYAIAEPHYGGIAVFSKHPLQHASVKYYGLSHRPRIQADVQIESAQALSEVRTAKSPTFTLICMHPKIPTRTALLRERNEELKEIAHDAKSSKLPIIVFGDMNCTSFSCYFTDFMQDGGLIDTEQGFGVQPSWNALLLTPILPIDHCFTSPQFVTRQRNLTEHTGADHVPVFVELSLAAKSSK